MKSILSTKKFISRTNYSVANDEFQNIQIQMNVYREMYAFHNKPQ